MDSPVHNTAKCGHIWTESGMGVVLALREASAIDEGEAVCEHREQYVPSKEYVRSEWRQMGSNLMMNGEDR